MVRVSDPYGQTILNVGSKGKSISNLDKTLSILKAKEEKIKENREERAFKQSLKEIPSQLPKEQREKIKSEKIETYQIKKEEKQLNKLKEARTSARLKNVKEKAERLSNIGNKIFSQKMLKKPSVSVPKYNSTKLLKQMANQQGALVRQVEPRELVQDNRSLFFKDEFNNENKSRRNWLFKD